MKLIMINLFESVVGVYDLVSQPLLQVSGQYTDTSVSLLLEYLV